MTLHNLAKGLCSNHTGRLAISRRSRLLPDCQNGKSPTIAQIDQINSKDTVQSKQLCQNGKYLFDIFLIFFDILD